MSDETGASCARKNVALQYFGDSSIDDLLCSIRRGWWQCGRISFGRQGIPGCLEILVRWTSTID